MFLQPYLPLNNCLALGKRCHAGDNWCCPGGHTLKEAEGTTILHRFILPFFLFLIICYRVCILTRERRGGGQSVGGGGDTENTLPGWWSNCSSFCSILLLGFRTDLHMHPMCFSNNRVQDSNSALGHMGTSCLNHHTTRLTWSSVFIHLVICFYEIDFPMLTDEKDPGGKMGWLRLIKDMENGGPAAWPSG